MEERFVCEYTPTVKMLASQARKRHPVRVVVFLLIGIVFFSYMLHCALMFHFQGIWSLFFLIGVTYLLWSLAMPEINAYLAIRRMKKGLGGEDPLCKITFGESIEIKEGTIRIIWEYSEINRIHRYKHSYVLAKNKQLGIILDPNGLTEGTFEGFKAFLRQKLPALQIPE